MSTGNTDYAADITIWHQVLITSANNTIVLSDTVLTDEQITITPGVYFVSTDDSGPANYNYLLTEIETQINAAVSGAGGAYTYSFSLATPTLSSAYTNGGVIFATSDSSAFTLKFADAAFTAQPEIWGRESEVSNILVASGTIMGGYTQLGRWQAPPDHYPHDIRDNPTPHTLTTGGSWQTRGSLKGEEVMGRAMLWKFLPAAVVHGARAGDSTLAADASLAQNDRSNGLKAVHAAQAYDLSLCYGTPSTNIDAFEVAKREVVTLPPNAKFRALVTDVPGGESYHADLQVGVTSRTDSVILDPYLG